MQNRPRKYVLLDRDGTIIVNKHYQKDPDITELLPNAAAGLALLREHGFGLVVVTNQSGVGRGYLSLADLQAVNRRMCELLGGDDVFAGIYFCPHVPDDGCACRKPLPGLVASAASDLGFTPAECVVVGDSEADIRLGDAVGAATVLVRTGHGAEVEGRVAADFVADDLLDAARWIIRRSE